MDKELLDTNDLEQARGHQAAARKEWERVMALYCQKRATEDEVYAAAAWLDACCDLVELLEAANGR